MDLVFNALPDVFSYQSFRHTTYDAPWLNDANANKARRKQPVAHPSPSATPSSASASCSGGGGAGQRRDSCPLCQEKQRRPLATYIRSKSRQDRREESSIQEEEEEEEEEEEGKEEAAAVATARGQTEQHAVSAAAPPRT